ncbi:MAG: hypothetical protein AAF483_10190 [Planctomycetota bacterium]
MIKSRFGECVVSKPIPISFYFISGRLLAFGVACVVTALLSLWRGSINLAGLFGLWGFYVGWKLYWMRPGARWKSINFYQVIFGLNILGLLVLLFVGLVLVSGGRLAAEVQVAMGSSPLTVVLSALAFFLADLAFARWAQRKLRSDEYHELLGYGELERSWDGRQFGLAGVFMWTTVFAVALSTCVYDVRSRPLSYGHTRGASINNGISAKYIILTTSYPWQTTEQFFVEVQLVDNFSNRSNSPARDLVINQDRVYLDGELFQAPMNHNVVFFNHDGSTNSAYIPCDSSQLRSFITQKLNRGEIPAMEDFQETVK